MTTYKGDTLKPNEATENQAEIIKSISGIDENIKELIERKNELLSNLPEKTPLVVKVEDEYKTVIVDEPVGHYVYYKTLELTMNAKTTKVDLKELSL